MQICENMDNDGLILIEKSVILMVSPIINRLNDQWHADFHTISASVMNVNIPAVLFSSRLMDYFLSLLM